MPPDQIGSVGEPDLGAHFPPGLPRHESTLSMTHPKHNISENVLIAWNRLGEGLEKAWRFAVSKSQAAVKPVDEGT